MTELRARIQQNERKLDNLHKLRSEVEQGLAEKLQQSKDRRDKSTLYDYFNTSFEGQMRSIQQAVAQLQQEIKVLVQSASQVDASLTEMVSHRTNLTREKEALLLKKETLERFK